ncbi:hypothetical protein Ddc_15642 [Ditylenchus destructor]|nr:hypothetical protein Ddc_15642 [Ditylenchus destructor]
MDDNANIDILPNNVLIKLIFDRCGRYLRHLTLRYWSARTAMTFLRMAPNVQHLKIFFIELDDECLKQLPQIVPSLKSLDLKISYPLFYRMDNDSFTDYGLMGCLKELTLLEYLCVYEKNGEMYDLFDKQSFVQFPPNLKYLDLSPRNAGKFLNCIAKGCKNLKGLRISTDQNIDEDVFKAISQLKSLKYLAIPIGWAPFNIEYVFEALTELRALEIHTIDEKAIIPITLYCNKLEHLYISEGHLGISDAEHANILRLASLPSLCSIELSICYSKEQTTELVNRLIANGNLQYINMKTTQWPLEFEVLFELLRRCKSIRAIAMNFAPINLRLYSTICAVVDEINEEDHPIVEVQISYYNNYDEDVEAMKSYKWLRFKHVPGSDRYPASIKIFDKDISPEAYNKWVTRNQYSKQIPLEGQDAAKNQSLDYQLLSFDLKRCGLCPIKVFNARVKLNHENWPLFQHFVRLLTDPFIYIRNVRLSSQSDVLNLLAGAINQNRGRLQCKKLNFYLEVNCQKKFVTWIKDHVRCDEFQIHAYSSSNFDEELLDFFLTGAQCTSAIKLQYYEPPKVILEFVQKFMYLKKCDEYQVVEDINCEISSTLADRSQYANTIEVLKRDYAKFVIPSRMYPEEEERDEDDDTIHQPFEFINEDIGKKLHLTILIHDDRQFVYTSSYIRLNIENL